MLNTKIIMNIMIGYQLKVVILKIFNLNIIYKFLFKTFKFNNKY
jgi:hypothetical protein